VSGISSLDGLPLVMGADDLAKVIGCSPDHARRLIREGDFDDAVMLVGGRKRISRYLLEKKLRGELGEAA
jgi:hypothetical protein